jgi:dihydrofolate reductase
MPTPQLVVIAAIEEKTRAMGINNKLLWRIAGDLPRFKALTEGQVVIMGKNTYLSIGKPLPNRYNIVVSKTIGIIDGVAVAHSFANALALAKTLNSEKIFFIGGEEVFRAALPIADVLHLTLVRDKEVKADAFFPAYEESFVSIIGSEESHLDHSPPFRYVDFVPRR